jgi:hypothetical protein
LAGAAAAAIVLGSALPAHAATQSFGSQTCTNGLRAAIYLGAKGTIDLEQEWSGGSHSQEWSNGSTATTRVKVVPIGVATMTRGTGTYGYGWTQAGKDCRIW